MSESVDLSEEFHEFIVSHNRDDETLEETLQRLVGGPNPEAVCGILSGDTAERMRSELAGKYDSDAEAKRKLRERFE